MHTHLLFNEEERSDAARLLKPAAHPPGEDYIVPHVLIYLGVRRQDRLGHLGEVLVQKAEVPIRLHLVGERRRALQVEEHEDAGFPPGLVVTSGHIPE